MSLGHDRDELLGAALRELRAPEHRPGFWDELEAGLAAGRRPSGPRDGIRPQRRWAFAAAAAACIAGVVLAIGLPGSPAPDRALAEEVKLRVAEAVATLEDLQARATYRSVLGPGDERTQRITFALTAAGDSRRRGDFGEVSYDAETGVERAINESASLGFGRFYSVRTGVAPGPPDEGPTTMLPEEHLGAAVGALLAADDPRVSEIEFDGRPAWRLVTAVEPNTIYADVDRVEIVVDRETALPVHAVGSLDGEFRSEFRVADLRVNEGIPAAELRLEFPADADVARTDAGFERLPLERAAAAAGYPPLVPTEVPAGYALREVAFAERASATGPRQANPGSRAVVSLSYRRGFEQFVVTTRLAGSRPAAWRDPFGVAGLDPSSETVTIAAGALAGAEAELTVAPRTVPHLWTVADDLLATVAGDLSGEELLAVASSLAPRP